VARFTPQIRTGVINRERINNLSFRVFKAKEENAYRLRLGTEGADNHIKGIPHLAVDFFQYIPDGIRVIWRDISNLYIRL
jgi:hypothetical protein